MNTEPSIIQEADTIRQLIRKHLSGELSQEEDDLLRNWLADSPQNLLFFQQITDKNQFALLLQKYSMNMALLEKDGIPELMLDPSTVGTAPMHFLRKWGWAAASIIVMLAIGAYFLTISKKNNDISVITVNTGEIQPGKEGAILTLADGTQVVLDSARNGLIALQSGAQAMLKDGRLIYDPTGAAVEETVYNTMSTPKGRQFQLTLPDGTRVWLNSASSIRFPTAFAGAARRVTLKGEAYFEVVKNAKMPFRLNVNDITEVDVLGTSFNVNAYSNETAINTTLLEGSVSVNGTIILPGQQAQILNGAGDQNGKIKIVSNVNTDKVMAWKNGLFNFKDASLEEIMRQLERWYDIDVVYEKGIPDIRLAGEISRDVTLSGLLIALKKMGVQYRLEGRKLVVLP